LSCEGGGLQAQQEIAGALQEAADIKGRAESLMKDTEEQLAGARQQQAELDQRQEKMAGEMEDLLQRQVSKNSLAYTTLGLLHCTARSATIEKKHPPDCNG
jgi:hypothetical protein